VSVVELLLEHECITPLIAACSEGHVSVVELLLEHEGITPLIAACSEGHVSVVELLLENEGVDAIDRDKDGTRAVMVAALSGHNLLSLF
jgi:ankyrin repeat protein